MTAEHAKSTNSAPYPQSKPWQATTPRMTIPIFDTPISNYLWPDVGRLNTELADVIRRHEQSDPGIVRSNVGGWHSATDLFDWDFVCITELRKRLRAYISDLFANVMIQDSPSADREFHFEAWANILRYGQYHSVHSHPNAFWSGVYYVTGNPDAGPAHPFSGKLELLDPRPGASLQYSEGSSLYGRFLVNPSSGQMVIFPGWLQHQVHPLFGDGERITIAFNVIPRW